MPFRANEAAQRGCEQLLSYLIPRPGDMDESEREKSKEFLENLIDEIGPVVDAYPSWHPLVRNHENRFPKTMPNTHCRYQGLDHTRYFANGFVTCPYNDGQAVIDSVSSLPDHPIARITAERLDVKLYNPNTTAILVKCNWNKSLGEDGMIPLSIAIPLLLEQEVPCWRVSQVAETWERMRSYFLGSPHGARSSLFVNQETGQAMRKIWNSLIHTGMFGPIKV